MNFLNFSNQSLSSNVEVIPNIYVLPCLQELKTGSRLGSRLVGFEYEQEPSKWENNQLKPLFSGITQNRAGDASSYFDRYWSGKDTSIPNDVSKNGLLNIPSFSKYGFKSQCKEMHITAKWKMYTQFLCDQFNTMDPKDNNVAILVTHHNRMRDTDLKQGLLPFRSKKISTDDGEEKSAYANNFCLKIQINPGTAPTFEVFFTGFPDKGEFKGSCSGTPPITPTSSFSSDDLTGGGKEYYYECDISNINTDVISAGIKDALNGPQCTKPMTIFVIRHGNALHNKPVETSSSINRLDSSLTPLGMYQAKILADKFKQENVFSNSNVILCCSFLQRTQLTGLLLLEAAGVYIGSMQEGLNKMREQAIMRYNNISKDSKIFETYPPANSDIPSFEKYYTDLMKPSQVKPSQGGKRRYSKYNKKVKSRKSRKTRKSRKQRKSRKSRKSRK